MGAYPSACVGLCPWWPFPVSPYSFYFSGAFVHYRSVFSKTLLFTTERVSPGPDSGPWVCLRSVCFLGWVAGQTQIPCLMDGASRDLWDTGLRPVHCQVNHFAHVYVPQCGSFSSHCCHVSPAAPSVHAWGWAPSVNGLPVTKGVCHFVAALMSCQHYLLATPRRGTVLSCTPRGVA